jgi:hypothetical protein
MSAAVEAGAHYFVGPSRFSPQATTSVADCTKTGGNRRWNRFLQPEIGDWRRHLRPVGGKMIGPALFR